MSLIDHVQQRIPFAHTESGTPPLSQTTGDPTSAERIARRTLHHQAAKADQARWWVDAYLNVRAHSLR